MKNVWKVLTAGGLVAALALTGATAALAAPQDGNGKAASPRAAQAAVCVQASDCANGGVRPQDGTGNQYGKPADAANGSADCSADGDGANGGVRPQDGTGNQYGKPADAANGSADCSADGDCANGGVRPQDGTGNRYGKRA